MLWSKFYHPRWCIIILVACERDRTLSLCPVYSFMHVVANPGVNKSFPMAEKRPGIELRKAGIPLKRIREQLKILESSLRRILKLAKENSLDHVAATNSAMRSRGFYLGKLQDSSQRTFWDVQLFPNPYQRNACLPQFNGWSFSAVFVVLLAFLLMTSQDFLRILYLSFVFYLRKIEPCKEKLLNTHPGHLLWIFCMTQLHAQIYTEIPIGKPLLKIGAMLRKAMLFHSIYWVCVPIFVSFWDFENLKSDIVPFYSIRLCSNFHAIWRLFTFSARKG